MSKTTESKRGRGRPRNAALDALEKELAVSRRHASTMLREMKKAGGGTSENSDNSEKPVSPLAEARLEKVLKECRLLETKIRTADLEARTMARELLHQHEAAELIVAAIGPVADGLRSMPKALAPRLTGQPLQDVENTLTEAANRLLKLGSHGIQKFREKTAPREL
jgi:hypothetical protein